MERHDILIFSDNKEWRKDLSLRLSQSSFTCNETDNIEAVYQYLQARKTEALLPVCVLDWNSEHQISRKLWDQLNLDPQYNDIMIVILTHQVDEEILKIVFNRKNSEVYGKNVLELFPPRLRKLIHSQSSYSQKVEGKNLKHLSQEKSPGTLLTSVDHNFRTQMNSIMGMVNMLHSTPLTAEQKEYIEIIEKSSSSLSSILYDVIDYSRLSTGDLHLDHSLFNIQDLTSEVIELFRVKAEKQQVDLILNFEPDVPSLVSGDPEKIRQVLHNLISNAVKYTLDGHINIHVCCQSQQDDMVNLRFEILDTGYGITDEKLEMMNLFFEDEKLLLPDSNSGIGLGLYITKQLIALMGGTLRTISQRGEGSTFWFDINIKSQIERRSLENRNDSIPRIPTRKEDHLNISSAQRKYLYKILIVEDDIINQKVLSLLIEKNGYQFDICSSGMEAINMLARTSYDLIIMDVQMPEMDGFETTEVIRSRPSRFSNHTTPIIGITAYTGSKYKALGKKSGMNDLIFKPYDEVELSVLLHKYLIESDLKGAPLDLCLHSVDKEAKIENTQPLSHHLNTDTILQMYKDFGEEALSLLEMFKIEMSEKLKKIRVAVDETNPQILKEVAHSLKTNSATFGANELSDICLKFEKMGRKNTCKGAKNLLIELEKESQRVMEDLASIDFKSINE